MSNPKLLLPLRIPELGPSLGKLVTGTPRPSDWLPLDGTRYRLATCIISSTGEARRLAANEERAAALAAIGRAAWQEAWEEAVSSVADLVLSRIAEQLEAEAVAVGMSRRRRGELGIGAADRRALVARLGSVGSDLVPVLDELDERANDALDATALNRGAVEAWQESLKLAARHLEAAWLALEQGVEREESRWRGVADQVAGWRRPLWPVGLAAALVLLPTLWLGLILGGYVDVPIWLQSAWSAIFDR
ncbi:MAG: hypothetical protein AMS18_00765 [Gemmatimonas sp. SG8_17]|nr:MAG: hypothetical protein AMS18_00765 [Gemmatimonas sp. SG8_17]